jgi:hypothetical protein
LFKYFYLHKTDFKSIGSGVNIINGLTLLSGSVLGWVEPELISRATSGNQHDWVVEKPYTLKWNLARLTQSLSIGLVQWEMLPLASLGIPRKYMFISLYEVFVAVF